MMTGALLLLAVVSPASADGRHYDKPRIFPPRSHPFVFPPRSHPYVCSPQIHPGVFPPQSHPYGKSYSQWAAAFWQWSLALPLEGHPFLDSPDDPYFDFGAGQSGNVWFWSSPDGPLTRIVTMPEGTALFLTIRDVETSSLETVNSGFHGDTEAEQRANSKWFADHIVDVFCIIDGVAVRNLQAYRFSTPQFEFTAPTPWIFGGPEPTDPNIGGTGTSVGDGYFLMLAPLSKGKHTIHYGGTFHFTLENDGFDADFPHDVTIQLTVVRDQRNGRDNRCRQ